VPPGEKVGEAATAGLWPALTAAGSALEGASCRHYRRIHRRVLILINKNLISLSHSKHTYSPRNAHSASAEGTDPV